MRTLWVMMAIGMAMGGFLAWTEADVVCFGFSLTWALLFLMLAKIETITDRIPAAVCMILNETKAIKERITK